MIHGSAEIGKTMGRAAGFGRGSTSRAEEAGTRATEADRVSALNGRVIQTMQIWGQAGACKVIRNLGCACLLGAFSLVASAQKPFTRNTTLLVDADRRPQISLDGEWHFITDPYGSALYDLNGHVRDDSYAQNAKSRNDGLPIEYDFEKSPLLKVPGDWNTQMASLFRYEGPLWYEKDFQYRKRAEMRAFIHIGAANYRAVVWMNGRRACQHEGGFTPFDCEVTNAMKDGANFIVIAVDATRLADGVPSLVTDWYNYGGLTRDVSLIEVPEEFIDSYGLHLDSGSRFDISGFVHVVDVPAGTAVQVSIPEAKAATIGRTDVNGIAAIHLHVQNLELWAPNHPKLYRVEIKAVRDEITDEIGFRSIEVKGTNLLLNGKPIFLRGISVHAEAPYRTGRACTDQDVQTLYDWVRELHANFVRLAHYPHDPRMTRMADRLGILVWSEIPDWQHIEFSNPHALEQARQVLTEMIRRDRNRASVILWSVANETPNTRARTMFLEQLVQQAHREDPTRPVTAALLTPPLIDGKRIVDDPLGDALDVIGVNEYIGWYQGQPEDADTAKWVMRYHKPIILSEFGAGAKAGYHGSAPVRWTEEYQANVYRHQLRMLARMPQLRGVSPWILMDFRSPSRNLPGIQDGFNRKGLISDQGKKKLAFFVLQHAYESGMLDHVTR